MGVDFNEYDAEIAFVERERGDGDKMMVLVMKSDLEDGGKEVIEVELSLAEFGELIGTNHVRRHRVRQRLVRVIDGGGSGE